MLLGKDRFTTNHFPKNTNQFCFVNQKQLKITLDRVGVNTEQNGQWACGSSHYG